MKVTVTCKDRVSSDYLYDLLTERLSGEGVLKGKKECIDSHEMLPDVMEFNLTEEEVKAVKALPGVLLVTRDFNNTSLVYQKTKQTGVPIMANWASPISGQNNLSHPLYYSQVNEVPLNPVTDEDIDVFSVNCSNVDVIIVDSGVDPFHDDFYIDQVIDFNWPILRDDNNNLIINNLPLNYNRDINGHGTSCASLVAGKLCGFAKGAKIYSLKCIDSIEAGINVFDALKLTLAFQKAKKQNLYGLDSSRPTIMSNSWKFISNAYLIPWFKSSENPSTLNLSLAINQGKSTDDFPNPLLSDIPAFNTVADGYIRAILDEGVHVITAAGNENTYLEQNTSVSAVNIYAWDNNTTSLYITLRENINKNLYTINQIVTDNTFSPPRTFTNVGDFYYPINYNSPNIGFFNNILGGNINFNKNNYPLINVGDVLPLTKNRQDVYFTDGAGYTAYSLLLSSTDIGSNRLNDITNDKTVRYNSVYKDVYIKSGYSNYGPGVDILAPGNAAYAAISNDLFYDVTKENMPWFTTGTYSVDVQSLSTNTSRSIMTSTNFVMAGNSEDNRIIIASSFTNYILSYDYGESWSVLPYVSNGLSFSVNLAISRTGRYITVFERNVGLIISNDFGKSFIKKTTGLNYNWVSTHMSKNGQYQAAIFFDQVNNSSGVFLSKDFGNTWNIINFFNNKFITCICMSEDGEYIYVSDYSDGVYKSDDYGTTFNLAFSKPQVSIIGSTEFLEIRCSDNGQYVYVFGQRRAQVYISHDFANNFFTKTLFNTVTYPSLEFGGISVTGDGEFITIGAYSDLSNINNNCFISNNFGTNWNIMSNFGKHIFLPFISNDRKNLIGLNALAQDINKIYANIFTPKDKYGFFNGTSSACPIVAGILATYLSDNPAATPAQARSWLLTNALAGNILQQKQTQSLPIKTNTLNNNEITLNLPMGSTIVQNVQTNPRTRIENYGYSYSLNFNTGNIDDLFFCTRMDNTPNLVAQPFPVRSKVISLDKSNALKSIGDFELVDRTYKKPTTTTL